jgi:3-hydroxy acid dehydrogenase / malonic semialdehyde reductase
MDDKIALVTGATRGIGRAITEALLAREYRVIAVGRDSSKLSQLAELNDRILPLNVDLTDADAVSRIVDDLSSDWRQIDVLINNAGHDVGGRQLFHEGTAQEWDDIIETNVKGLMRMTRAVIPGMLARGNGHVVNMGSVSGLFTYAGGTAYNASKFAVRAFTEALRKDYATTDIRVTEVLPGLVKTNFAESRLHGEGDEAGAFYDGFLAHLEPADVAAAVLYALDQPTHVNISQVVIEPTRIGRKES